MTRKRVNFWLKRIGVSAFIAVPLALLDYVSDPKRGLGAAFGDWLGWIQICFILIAAYEAIKLIRRRYGHHQKILA